MHSLWQETVKLPSFMPLEGEHKTDVLIIGGGLTGILCAWELLQRGVNYMLVEADSIAAGTSGHTTAKVTSQHGLIYHQLMEKFGAEKARMYLEANQQALKKYGELSREFPCDFEEKDSYVYSVNRPDKLEKECAALEKIGFQAEYVQQLPLPVHVLGAVRFAHQAQLHPLKLIVGLAQRLSIHEHTRVTSYDGKAFYTDRGKIAAQCVIIATHFPIFNKHGLYALKMYQHRSYVLAMEHAPDVKGMYVDEAEKGLSFRNAQNLLLFGGGDHRTGKKGGGWAELERLRRQYWPQSTVRYQWAAQDCMTLDGMPYIGRYAGNTPQMYVATGFNKWGITAAMTAAQMLADAVQGRENPYEPLFAPSRSMLHPQLALNALEATISLLTPATPRCPHLGCALKWNKQERSWDCACHGSRFSEDGELLDGPSTGNLRDDKGIPGKTAK